VPFEIDCPQRLCGAVDAALAAIARATGLKDGHLNVELVEEARIRQLNRIHRGRDEPTDVLAFPVDEAGETAGPRELGDVVICAKQARDLEEAAVHGVLHLAGYDHQTDDGEMLELQERVLSGLRGAR
jgi:probable rRNA maturation factor